MRPIDADKLKETIKELEVESPDVKATRFISRTIQEIFPQIIDDEPTIEAEPVKHGRWIIDYAEGSKIYHAHCSECNKEPDRNIGGDYYIDKLSDFCPNCGARMDGDSE